MANLFSIDKDLFEKLSKLEEMDYNEETGEYTDPETGEVFTMDYIMSQDENRKTKLTDTALYIRQLESEAQSQKDFAKSILDKAKSKEKRIEWLKDNILRSMSLFGDETVEDKRVKLSTRTTAAVEVTSMELLPKEYIRETVKVEPNKTEIKKAIQAGEIIAGAELKQNVSLIIR